MKIFSTFFLSAILILSLQNCKDEDLKSQIDIKQPVLNLTEGSSITTTIKSNKNFSSTDTVWVKLIGGDAQYNIDYSTSIPLVNDFIALVGKGTTDSLSFTLSALIDLEVESLESAKFQIVKYPNGYRLGLQEEIRLEITDKPTRKVEFSSSQIAISERKAGKIEFSFTGANLTTEFGVKVTNLSASENDYIIVQTQTNSVIQLTGDHPNIDINAKFDSQHESTETFTLEIVSVNADHIIGDKKIVTVSILNYNIGDNLVGEYLFNGNANDTSPNYTNNGTVFQASLTSDRKNHSNSCYLFDGVNDYISIADNDATDFTVSQNFSISLWASADATQNDLSGTINDILRKWMGDTQGYPFSISIINNTHPNNPNEIVLADYDNSACGHTGLSYSGQVTYDTFHHIVMIKNGSKLIQYIDNVKVSEVTTPVTCATNNTTPITIGCRGQLARFFSGKIDDIRFYNVAIDPSLIGELYNDPGVY